MLSKILQMGSLISNTETRSEILLNNSDGKAQNRVSKTRSDKKKDVSFYNEITILADIPSTDVVIRRLIEITRNLLLWKLSFTLMEEKYWKKLFVNKQQKRILGVTETKYE